MNTMDKIREAVDALDIVASEFPDVRDTVRKLTETHYLGLRALAAWLTESTNDPEAMLDYALRAFQSTGERKGEDNIPSGICITHNPVNVDTDRRGSTILVMLFSGDDTAPFVEYIYDTETDELTRVGQEEPERAIQTKGHERAHLPHVDT